MNHHCTEIERRVVTGEPLDDALASHARRCDPCDRTLSIPRRIKSAQLSRHLKPGPGFATRAFAAAVERAPRARARRRLAAGGLVAVAAAAIALVAWQLGERTSIEIAAVDMPVETPIDAPAQAPASELDLDLAELSSSAELSMDWTRIGEALSRFELGSMTALSTDQKREVQRALDRANKRSFELRAKLANFELALRRALEGDPPDRAGVDRLLDRIGETERALRSARIGAWVDVRRIAAGSPPTGPSNPARPTAPERPSKPARPERPSPPASRCDEVACLVDPSQACCRTSRGSSESREHTINPFADELPDRPSTADIRRAINTARGRIAKCRGYSGRYRVVIRVLKNGWSVADVKGELPAGFERCVTRAFRPARFPRSKHGVTVTIPFVAGFD